MIAKDKTTPAPTDKYGRAGHDAEMQMAFYLRRAFAEAPDIYVFNDLRLERGGADRPSGVPSLRFPHHRKQVGGRNDHGE